MTRRPTVILGLHARWLGGLACCVVMMLVASGAATAAGAAHARPASLIPVWAYANGANPVVGGRVVITVNGRPVRQLHARTSGLTNGNGVALLSVRRMPHQYTVVVRGGRVAGRRVPGAMSRVVTSRTGVVEVNPLTALVTELHHQRPSLGTGRAARLVKRYFGVPRWADLGDDLRDGPRWFNARRFVRDARRYGSINALDRAVARKILRGGSRFPRFVHSGVKNDGRLRHSATGALLRREVTAKQIVKKVFSILGETTVGIGAQTLVGGALGGLLQLASHAVGVELPKSEFEQVQDHLNALGAQVTELKGQIAAVQLSIANSDASRLLHSSDSLIGHINHASTELAFLASMNLKTDGRAGLAADISHYIQQNLLGAQEHFANLLNPAFQVASNPIKAVSHALGSSGFFDERESDEVRSVYDYYAAYQTELAVLLTNFWNTKPASYPVADQQARIKRIDDVITKSERESLKPTVPPGTFIDTRTPAFMWGMYSQSVSGLTVIHDKQQTSRTLHLGSFRNYQMPSFHDYRNLLKGAPGEPRKWLQSQVKVPLNHGLVWGSEGITTKMGITLSPHFTPGCEVRVSIFNLDKDAIESAGSAESGSRYNCHNVFTDPTIQSFLRSKSGGLLLLRYLAPGERYYW